MMDKTNNIPERTSEDSAMEPEAKNAPQILKIAWTRHANLDAASSKRTKAFYNIRGWITLLGVLATFFALITELYFSDTSTAIGIITKILLVTTPVLSSLLAAFATKFYSNGHWLIYRAGAEEVQKEIYFFRTILQNDPGRREYLEKRLARIQKQLYRNLGGEFAFEGFKGQIPVNHNPQHSESDPGFHDLTGDEYFKFRLENQLGWHNKRINERKRERRRMTLLILTAGGLGAVLAAWGGGLSIWVALTASITAALIGWQELRNVDSTIKTYSKVVMELTSLYDHWLNLEPEERTTSEFYKMVRVCEEVLWTQNKEWVRSMQEVLQETGLDREAELINRVIKESVESAERAKEGITEAVVEQTRESLEEQEKKVEETIKAALGSLAEEASSELVQQELDAMSKAVVEMAEQSLERASFIKSSLADIVKDLVNVDIGRDTSKEELNAVLARLPKTADVKG
jgi:hypothetical protein